MNFIGIDMAWSENNPSGLAAIKGDSREGNVERIETGTDDEELLEFVNGVSGDEPAIITIDAPLKVPNEEGRRPAEEVVGKLFSSYNAGAHPANRKRLSQWTDRVRGEEIVQKLEDKGFIHSPEIEEQEYCRKVFEVYPHPSMVALFDLDEIIKYKKKSGRDYETVWSEFRRLQRHLKELKDSIPSLKPPQLLETNPEDLRGKALKDYEDKLDAFFCAYLAYLKWVRPESCETLGNLEQGYIVTPIKENMHEELQEIRSQEDLQSF